MNLPLESRIQRLNEMMSEGRIIRNDWVSSDEQGREVACLLAALSPEAGEAESPAACPASVMPEWFAHLTPWIDDNGSEAEWPRVVRRYAACAARWSVLDDAAWRRVEIATRRVAVIEAMRHTSDEQVLAACRGVLVWLDADMSESSHAAVKAAARAAADAVSAAATWKAAEAAAWAASTASAAAKAAAETATAAATAGAAAVKAAVAETAAAWAGEAAAWAGKAAKATAADRIVDAVLSALEKECGM